jgi:hypothetical protein
MALRRPLRIDAPTDCPFDGDKRQPLWKGPQEDGITFSLLCKFLTCRERFRLRVVEGLKEDEGFKYATEFGSMWHEAEEAYAGGHNWRKKISEFYAKLREQFPADEREITKWFRICKMLFPLYINHWKADQRDRKPVVEEKPFRIKYPLPSGRTVILRGKIDDIHSQGKGTRRSLWVQENKTKGDRTLDAEGIGRTGRPELADVHLPRRRS